MRSAGLIATAWLDGVRVCRVELATQAPYGLGATTSDQLGWVELKTDGSGFLASRAEGQRRAERDSQLTAG